MLVCSPVELYYRCRSRNEAPGKRYRFWEYLGLTALARVNAMLSRHYVVLSQHLADVVRSHGARSPIDVIPAYGVDCKLFRPATQPSATIRQRLGLPTNGAMVFFSSRVAPEKDSETLLRAFHTLLQEGRQLWLLHRSGGYQQFLEEAKRLGVAERVIATDARHPLRGLALDYQASDLCVQASREEGLGFSPLEALACGIPVVASAVGGLRETIVDGETGWTYPVGEPSLLARCMAAALDNPDEARRRAAAGRRLVLQRYERGLVFDRLEAVLKGALDSASKV
jgi:glycosyltransferase involved in cell wall biosynthesis